MSTSVQTTVTGAIRLATAVALGLCAHAGVCAPGSLVVLGAAHSAPTSTISPTMRTGVAEFARASGLGLGQLGVHSPEVEHLAGSRTAFIADGHIQPERPWDRIASGLRTISFEGHIDLVETQAGLAGLKQDEGGHFLLLGVILDIESDVHLCRFRIVTGTIGC